MDFNSGVVPGPMIIPVYNGKVERSEFRYYKGISLLVWFEKYMHWLRV